MGADGLRIDRLTLRLPAGMEGRAHVLGRLLARQLAELALPEGEMRMDRLGLDPVRLDPGVGDLMLARSLARAVGARLTAAAAVPGAARPRRAPPAAGVASGPAAGPAMSGPAALSLGGTAPAASPGGAHA